MRLAHVRPRSASAAASAAASSSAAAGASSASSGVTSFTGASSAVAGAACSAAAAAEPAAAARRRLIGAAAAAPAAYAALEPAQLCLLARVDLLLEVPTVATTRATPRCGRCRRARTRARGASRRHTCACARAVVLAAWSFVSAAPGCSSAGVAPLGCAAAPPGGSWSDVDSRRSRSPSEFAAALSA